MSNRKFQIAICLLFCTVSFILGIVLNDFPYLSLERKVSLLDVIAIVATFFLAVSVPFGIDRWIKALNKLKEFFIDELKDLLLVLDNIESELESVVRSKRQRSKKDGVLQLLSKSELTITYFVEHFKEEFESQNILCKDLLCAYQKYKLELTGDSEPAYLSLMSNKVKIDVDFINKHRFISYEYKASIKKIINRIHKL